MEKKKKETVEFFKQMEENIYQKYEIAEQQKRYVDDIEFLDINEEDMYQFIDDDMYEGRVDSMFANSASCREGMNEYFVHIEFSCCFVISYSKYANNFCVCSIDRKRG